MGDLYAVGLSDLLPAELIGLWWWLAAWRFAGSPAGEIRCFIQTASNGLESARIDLDG
ncbi:MAG: hypothetical protein GY768_14780 [Planctomycetaceae bacterium]|nr:hypothetical protein [Planctomycetaceae bacterium]